MILVVDDQEENIFSLKKLLESKKFEVDTATSGEEALRKVLRNDYALIILDVQMPGIDGFEVAETLSGYSKTKDVPVIFLSAVNTDKKFITRGYASGGIDYITKPVDPDIFLLRVTTFHRLYEQTLALSAAQKVLEKEIDTRKKAQEELKDRVEDLNTTLESLPQIAFRADMSGGITFVNRKWFQYAASAAVFPQTHPGDVCLDELWTKAIKNGEALECEVRIRELGSELYRYHLLRITPIKNEQEIKSWVGTFTDIDDQKQGELRKDEFLSIASHELKTPLTSIKAYIQLLERIESQHPENVKASYIRRAHDQVCKLENLIGDLLDVSKIENGKLKMNKQPFDMEQLLSNVTETIINMNSHASIRIEREGPVVTEKITGDVIRIEQVLINFFTNAVKYAPGSDRIILRTGIEDDRVYIAVQDFGIGMPSHKKDKVFGKFYRAEESAMEFQGLGIGLYICAEIIKQHHGEYGVESYPGEGSTFYFTLPLS